MSIIRILISTYFEDDTPNFSAKCSSITMIISLLSKLLIRMSVDWIYEVVALTDKKTCIYIIYIYIYIYIYIHVYIFIRSMLLMNTVTL